VNFLPAHARTAARRILPAGLGTAALFARESPTPLSSVGLRLRRRRVATAFGLAPRRRLVHSEVIVLTVLIVLVVLINLIVLFIRVAFMRSALARAACHWFARAACRWVARAAARWLARAAAGSAHDRRFANTFVFRRSENAHASVKFMQDATMRAATMRVVHGVHGYDRLSFCGAAARRINGERPRHAKL
jgi:hypothetical protein